MLEEGEPGTDQDPGEVRGLRTAGRIPSNRLDLPPISQIGQPRRRHPAPSCRELTEGWGWSPKSFQHPHSTCPLASVSLVVECGSPEHPAVCLASPQVERTRQPFTPDIDLNSLKVAGGEDVKAGAEELEKGWTAIQDTAMSLSDRRGRKSSLVPRTHLHSSSACCPGVGASTRPVTHRPWGPASRLFTRHTSPQSQPASEKGVGEG